MLGASSLVGVCLLPLLVREGWRVVAYSRRERQGSGVEWQRLEHPPSSLPTVADGNGQITDWVCLAPIWVVPEYLAMLEARAVRRVVALSSTSLLTKNASSDAAEQALARRLAEGERQFVAWAEAHDVGWVILRPTLIYGLGRDRNVGEIARAIRHLGFFPIFGRASGLRQPVHAEDVAAACLSALARGDALNRAYCLSGGETLAYREMVCRVFFALGKRPRLCSVPLFVFRLAVMGLRAVPRFRHWSMAMAERMNRDLVFDHADAARDLGFAPRPFHLQAGDLPR